MTAGHFSDAELAELALWKLRGGHGAPDGVTRCIICGGLTLRTYACQQSGARDPQDISDRNCWTADEDRRRALIGGDKPHRLPLPGGLA